ncbi:MAG: outer membrane beta-barrel protein [Bacteroidales bacterium]|nr:outer membrane beta-barrel protein [Bacteroidales bacterium]
MKKFFVSIILFFVSVSLFAQEGGLGFFLGGSYYVGELNQRSVFYQPSPAFGLMYRHSSNERWGFRIEGNYTNLKGNDLVSSNSYQIQRNHSFSTKIWDIGAQVELNFKNYETDNLFYDYFTPYIATGALLSIIPDSDRQFEVAIPISLGFKYALTNTITAGLEWNYRWTNSDRIDRLPDDNFLLPYKQLSNNPDTDWYSFVGLIVTFRVFKETMTCPAF